MKKAFLSIAAVASLFLTSCSSDDDNNGDGGIVIDNPTSYVFERNGESSVSFGGQTTRISMGEEFVSALKDNIVTEEQLKAMFAHAEGEQDFDDADLNASGKNLRSKTAASKDFFSANTAAQAVIQGEFDSWIEKQVSEVFPNWGVSAVAGTPGQIADGSSTRYVNAKGLEYNQVINKGLIGALMVDQALNNYLGTAVLDEADNRTNNDSGTVAEGKSYTTMEHKWDEAYGYVFGLNADASNPNDDLGADSFLNKYLGRVEADTDFAGIANDIFEAFKLGRAAIVAKDYTVRDAQAQIIREKISEIIGIRAVYYLQQGKNAVAADDMGAAFHDLSEGYGFIYSLQFTRMPNSTDAYFTKAEVDGFLTNLMDDGDNGLWDVESATLDAISDAIAAKFSFSVAQAGE